MCWLLRFLSKACLIANPEKGLDSDGLAADPWKLCTVQQVEALKALIKVLPIWATGIVAAVNINQSFPVIQAGTMDCHFIGSLKIPPGSFMVFGILTLTVWIRIYDRVLVPFLEGVTGRSRGLSLKQRMGIGPLLSGTAMVAYISSGGEEAEGSGDPGGSREQSARRDHDDSLVAGPAALPARVGRGLQRDQTDRVLLLPVSQGHVEHRSGSPHARDGSRGLGGEPDREYSGRNVSWVDSYVNRGHYDFYYWILASLSLVNILYYLVCCWAYGSAEDSQIWGEEDTKEEETDTKHHGSPTASHV